MMTMAWIPLLLVAAGGALGAVLRFAAMRLTASVVSHPFPLGTLLVNVFGCAAIGLLMARLAQHESEATRLFLVTGVLGGFTTFSAFSWDVLQLLQREQMLTALLYVLASVFLSLAAVAGGYQLGR